MENKLAAATIHPDSMALAVENGTGRPWHTPVLSALKMSDTEGDPTISDDGLGDGLFS